MQAEKWWSKMAEVGCNGASERCGERWPCMYAGHISNDVWLVGPICWVHDPMKGPCIEHWMSFEVIEQDACGGAMSAFWTDRHEVCGCSPRLGSLPLGYWPQ
jgi:hypothetical protein